ncbi:TonB-dependent receptor [soil metagenome]
MLHDSPMKVSRASARLGGIALIGSTAFASWPAQAQTVLEPVVVTATRRPETAFDLPASVDRIDGEALDGRRGNSLSEALSLVPGVAARDRQNYAQDLQISVRGFGARSSFGIRGVRLYVDGVPATMPDGQGQLTHIDLTTIDRIEVMRGPFSTLYGNSSGGVVQLFTRDGRRPPTLTGSVDFGSDSGRRYSSVYSGGSETAGVTASVQHFETQGYRDHSGARRNLGNVRGDWQVTPDDSLTFSASSVEQRADDPLGLTRDQFETAPEKADPAASQFDTRKLVRQTQAGVVWDHRLDASQALRAMVYAGTRSTVQFQSIPVATQANPRHPGGVIDLDRDYTGTDLRWVAGKPMLPFDLTLGISYDQLAEHRTGYQNFDGSTLGVLGALRRDERNRAIDTDPYLQLSWPLAERLTVDAGVRRSLVRFKSHDHYIVGSNGDDSGQLQFDAWLPVLALRLALSQDWRAYVTAGRGFETPTLNELAYRPDGLPGLNTALAAARSVNLETGLQHRYRSESSTLDAALAVFRSDTDDEIVTATNSGGRTTYRNAGKTRRDGVELSVEQVYAAAWRWSAAYTWLDAKYRTGFATCAGTPCTTPNAFVAKGLQIAGTARQSLHLEAGWRPERGFRAGVEATYAADVPVDDRNSDAAPSYVVTALAGGYVEQFGDWTVGVDLRIDNLANRRYAGSVIVNESNGRAFEPAPGRVSSAALTLTRAL